jgi:hypothetical protein
MQLSATIATFCVFMVEALLHYNIGVNHNKDEQFRMHIPKMKDIGRIALIVAFFAIINGFIIGLLHSRIKHG